MSMPVPNYHRPSICLVGCPCNAMGMPLSHHFRVAPLTTWVPSRVTRSPGRYYPPYARGMAYALSEDVVLPLGAALAEGRLEPFPYREDVSVGLLLARPQVDPSLVEPSCLGGWDGSWVLQNNMEQAMGIGSAGWWFGTFSILPYFGNVIIPIDELIFFQRNCWKPPTIYHRLSVYIIHRLSIY